MTEQAAAGASPPVPGARLIELVRVMDVLRRNCPWDARQTHASLTPYLLEETYELVDALASGDAAAVREELGDVLLQVVFHARVAQERTDGTGYTIDEVADGIIAKLTRRHPHVFGEVTVSGPDEVSQNWEAIKAAERAAKRASARAGGESGGGESANGGPADSRPASSGSAGDRESVLDGVPLSQPALSLAAQLLRRAERAGAPPGLADAGDRNAGAGQDRSAGAETGAADVGRELLDLVNRARAAGLDPELELRAAALAYADRVRAWEAGPR